MNELTRRGFFGAVAAAAVAPKQAELPELPFDPFAGGGPWAARAEEAAWAAVAEPFFRYQPRTYGVIMPLSLALRLEDEDS